MGGRAGFRGGRGTLPETLVTDVGRECTKCGRFKIWDEYYTHPAGCRGHMARCKKCVLESQKPRSHDVNLARKIKVMEAYGGKCACCGETELAFLTIDHVNNDGADHRREIGKGGLYYWLVREGFPEGFQVLCANCNLAKEICGACPHTYLAISSRGDSMTYN